MGKRTKPVNRSKFDWVKIRAEWEAGGNTASIAKEHGCSSAAISQHKMKDGWTPKHRIQVKRLKTGMLADELEGVTDENKGENKDIPRGRSIGQPLGEIGADKKALSQISALTNLSTPEVEAITKQAIKEIEITKIHRRVISRASVIAEAILVRIHALVIDGVASDVITFKTKDGQAYHRVPFLGDRESVSDALLKCANAISKLVPLERQAHGLTDNDQSDKLPIIHFNMPNVKVVSVDGHGKVVPPAMIDGKAQDVTQEETPTVQ